MAEQSDPTTELHRRDSNGQDVVGALLQIHHPDAVTPSLARPVVVGESETMGIDVRTRLVPASRITAVLSNESRPVGPSEVFLWFDDNGWTLHRTVTDMKANRVPFDRSPGGHYRLTAWITDPAATPGDPAARLWSSMEIVTDGTSAMSVPLSFTPAGRVSGRLLFEGMAGRPDPPTIWLVDTTGPTLSPLGGVAALDADGTFVINGIRPGRYVIQGGDQKKDQIWSAKSVIIDGLDVLDVPFEIASGAHLSNLVVTLTDRQSDLSGTVTDGTGQPVHDMTVVAFSPDERHWWPGSRRVQVAQPDMAGRYTIRGLPPGDYAVGVVSEDIEEFAPALRPLLAASIRLTLGSGERKSQDLRLR